MDVSNSSDGTEIFDRLLALNWRRFYCYARRLCENNTDLAGDLMSESLIDAYKGFSMRHAATFDRWFYKIMVNNRIDMIRSARTRETLSLDALFADHFHFDVMDRARSVESHVVDSTLSETVQNALTDLPESFRMPIVLCDIDDWSYEEISGLLKIPVGTVRSRIHRGREKMRIALTREMKSSEIAGFGVRLAVT
jgi:RNA polymerase sigma-70 factor, ECF subfamily